MAKSATGVLRGQLAKLTKQRADVAHLRDPGDALRLIDAEIARVVAALDGAIPVPRAVKQTRQAFGLLAEPQPIAYGSQG